MNDLLSIGLVSAAIISPVVITVAIRYRNARNAVKRRLEDVSGRYHSGGVVNNPSVTQMILSPDFVVSREQAERMRDDFRRRYHNVVGSPFNPIVEADGHRVLQSEVTSGDPLPAAMIHRPNIGGLGNPDYAGPNYVEPIEIAEEMRGIRRYAETFREWRERVGKPARHGDQS
jgi:hypothetical protein